MKVLVTGATGYVGSWTAKALQDAGHEVRLLVRTPAKVAQVAGAIGVTDPEIAPGDLTDRDSILRALEGCGGVIHAGASVALTPGHDGELTDSNVIGTQNMLGLAAEAGVSRIVHVSSCSVLWHRGSTEYDVIAEPGGGDDPYSLSKARAESYARSLQDQGAPVVITYPSAVIGPAAGRHLGEAGNGVGLMVDLRIVPGRGAEMSLVDVRDVAAAHAALIDAPVETTAGGRFILGGHHLGGKQLAQVLTQLAGHRVVYLPVPDPLLIGFGAFADRFRSAMPSLVDGFTRSSMHYLTHAPAPDNTPVVEALGVDFRPAQETLRETVEALRALKVRA